MSRSGKWFRKLFQAGPSQGRNGTRRDQTRLTVEGLEDRCVPTIVFLPQYGQEGFQDKGGLRLNDVPVYLIFWGSYWKNTTTDATGATPTAQEIQSEVQSILGGPYLRLLTQYGVNGNAHLAGTYFDNSDPSSGSFDGSQLSDDVVDTLQDNGSGLPEADDLSVTPLYCVVTPPGVMSKKGNAASFNGMQYDVDFPFTDPDQIPLIWLGGVQPNGIPQNGTVRDWYSTNFSHELAEAITDINGDAIRVSPTPAFTNQFGANATGQEIGDNEADQYTYRVNGVLTQSLWSQRDGAYVVSDGTAPTFSVNGRTLTLNGDATIDVAQSGPSQGGVRVTYGGAVAQFEPGQLTGIQVSSAGNETLTLNALPSGVSLFAGAGGNLTIIYGESNTVQGPVNVSVSGKLTVINPGGANHSVIVTGASVAVDSNSPLQYLLSSHGSLEVDGGYNASFTVQSTPYGGEPLAIATTDVNNTVTLPASSGPVTVSTLGQDVISASVQAGGQWTLSDLADPYGVDVTIRNNTVQYHNYVTLTLAGMQALAVNGSPANTHFTVQSTPAGAPLALTTGTGTNTVDVAGAAGALTIDAHGTDTVNIGSARTLDGVAPVTVHGDGRTVLTLTDQTSSSSVSFGLVVGHVERDVHGFTTTTTLFNYDNVSSLTLTGGDNVSNAIDIESTAVPTYINGGAATGTITVDYNLKNLDNIGAYLSIAGASSSVSVYDQADPHASSGTPVAYTVGNDGVTRDAVVNGSNVHTRIDTVPVQGVALDTSQTSGSRPNTVSVESGTAAPVQLISGAADAITVGLGGPVNVDAHGGTVTLDDRALHNDDTGDTTDTFTLGYTVTDHTVVRNEHWHMVEYIDWSQIPPNPKDPPPPPGSRPPVVVRDYYYNGTLNYQNVKSLTINGGQVNSAFAVQSTPAGTPMTITGGAGPGTSNQFTVGVNGSVKNIHSQLTLSAGSASATLLVDDSLAASTTPDAVTLTNGPTNDTRVGMALTDQFFGSGGGLDCTGMGALTLNLSRVAGAKVSLSPSAETAFFINANGTGAELDLDLTGVTNPQQTGSGSGTFTFGNRKSVFFQNFATVHAR